MKKYKLVKIGVCICLFIGMVTVLNTNNVKAVIVDNLPKVEINQNFPDNYNIYLNRLKQQHPNWIFKAVHTGLDWNNVLIHETYDVNESISLVPSSYGSEWKKDGMNIFKDGNFVVASKGAVGYTLDPRNFFDENTIFQFETLNYSGEVHTKETIEKILWGTSIWNRSEYKRNGSMIGMGYTYSDYIIAAGRKYDVSPVHIASRLKQETGGDIIYNSSINGSKSFDGGANYPYNFFNVGAIPDENGNNAVTNGLKYAHSKGWFNPEISIDGGVLFLGNSYINRGQNTIYFQKYDVNNQKGLQRLCAHQYMTNILAPSSEAKSLYNGYNKAGMLSSSFEFLIPVYKNMPEIPARVGDSYIYEQDATYMEVCNVSPDKLNVRSGAGTEYPIIGNASEGDVLLRIAKNKTSQWDKIRLSNGIEGYVHNGYLKDTNIPNIALFEKNYLLNRGDELQLNPFFSNTNNKEYEITIDNPVVAKVENGKIVGQFEGQTAFSIKLKGTNKEAKGYLKVEDRADIKLVEDCYQIGVFEQLNLNLEITNTNDKSYEIIIDNPAVAKVENGKIVGQSEGQTAFTIKLKNSNKSARGYLKVIDNRNISLNENCY
ncbi:MAG: SH3 domain-containing protein, partial [Clostridia bacterium]